MNSMVPLYFTYMVSLMTPERHSLDHFEAASNAFLQKFIAGPVHEYLQALDEAQDPDWLALQRTLPESGAGAADKRDGEFNEAGTAVLVQVVEEHPHCTRKEVMDYLYVMTSVVRVHEYLLFVRESVLKYNTRCGTPCAGESSEHDRAHGEVLHADISRLPIRGSIQRF
jgi:hypothetical protein